MIQQSDINYITDLFPCFSALSRQEWELAEMITVMPSSPHAIREGRELQHAVFVLSGSLRIYKISRSGKEVTLYRVGNGECCVLMMASILGEMEYEASVQIETDTRLLLFPVDRFREWMHLYKPLRQMIYGQFVSKWTEVATLLEHIAFDSIPERIYNFLIQRQSSGLADNLIKITHEQLAIELGTSREVVSRTLKKFSDEGAIVLRRGSIQVLSLEKIHLKR